MIIYSGGETESMKKILETAHISGITIKTLFTIKHTEGKKNDLILHLESEDISSLISQLKEKGFSLDTRDHIPYFPLGLFK